MSHISSRAGRVDHGDDDFADLETRAVEGMKLLLVMKPGLVGRSLDVVPSKNAEV